MGKNGRRLRAEVAEASPAPVVETAAPRRELDDWAVLGRNAPRALRDVTRAERLALVELMRAGSAVHLAEADQAEAVATLRARGFSWDSIGWASGITGEGARQRWGRAG